MDTLDLPFATASFDLNKTISQNNNTNETQEAGPPIEIESDDGGKGEEEFIKMLVRKQMDS